ncbi:MAG: hypothetical protein EXR75_03695 [Myxococcales bacterium]|nr:hypothetical protein [Myxococcales bacterium]
MRRAIFPIASVPCSLYAVLLAGCTAATEPVPDAPIEPNLGPGEICFAPSPTTVRLRFEPHNVMLAPGQTRIVRVVVDPDFCTPTAVTFASSVPEIVGSPATATVDYGAPTISFSLTGKNLGASTVVAEVPRGDGTVATASLEVEVLDPTLAKCANTDDTTAALLTGGAILTGKGTLTGASLALPEGADAPNSGSFIWSVAPFDASLACANAIVPAGHLALGPAVTFGPENGRFLRDLPISVPFNPARIPDLARLRHVRVAYEGPSAPAPRIIPVANPRLAKVDGAWTLSFSAPRLGTYQVVVREDAGTKKRSRRLTHRAVVGVSMGGAGAAQFGLRHHQLFDVVAPLGGPVDWTWLASHLEQNHLGGFRPIAPGTKLVDIELEKRPCNANSDCKSDETCLGVVTSPATTGKCTLISAPNQPYEHSSTFDNWWYEYPREGHGGSFDRANYMQIFRDLALMFGNPNGYNPKQLNLPAGVDPNHPSQIGDHPPGECNVVIDPLDGHPDEAHQKELDAQCPAERCKYTQTLSGYFDDEYNPDGTFPVITVCDGSPQNELLTPYANTWTEAGHNRPLEVALAVDYDGDGQRDELEPLIRAGHEPWDDWGQDQTPSALEPGFGPKNLDPSLDDYDPQFNPTGTEGNYRYEFGEPYRDFGLDGVNGTILSPYDFGEGDGKFTAAPGLERMWNYDAHSLVHNRSSALPVPLDDDALARIDFWTDGGTRDLFNFAVAAQELTGTFAARGRDVAYFSELTAMPGLDPSKPNEYDPASISYDDLQGAIFHRYGKNEPTAKDLVNGSGQHVGTANEIATRLQSAFYFMGSRWPDAPRALVESSQERPAEGIDQCQILGNCVYTFTAKDGRTGPVAVSLPPGYAHAAQQGIRYPVIYMLHGYGMTPEDLQAAIVFFRNWMNGASFSQASRLPKAILVYVDGRCRTQDPGDGSARAECIRGTFFTDSIRPDGPQMDKWWLELMDDVDQRFRTMGESVVESTE